MRKGKAPLLSGLSSKRTKGLEPSNFCTAPLVRHYRRSGKVSRRARHNQAEHDREHERDDQLPYT
jgi:hypothetical protein